MTDKYMFQYYHSVDASVTKETFKNRLRVNGCVYAPMVGGSQYCSFSGVYIYGGCSYVEVPTFLQRVDKGYSCDEREGFIAYKPAMGYEIMEAADSLDFSAIKALKDYVEYLEEAIATDE